MLESSGIAGFRSVLVSKHKGYGAAGWLRGEEEHVDVEAERGGRGSCRERFAAPVVERTQPLTVWKEERE